MGLVRKKQEMYVCNCDAVGSQIRSILWQFYEVQINETGTV